jgi:hypothetical protein
MMMRKMCIAVIMVLLMGIATSGVMAQTKTTATSKTTVALKKVAPSPLRIERASLLPSGEIAFDAGVAFESSREILNLEYDNLRLSPLGMRFGVTDSLEVGGFLGFSSNSRDDRRAPDESGLEGISIFGKLALNEFVALQVGLTMGGNDDVFPYPNDEIDLFINLPMQRTLEKGLLYGEFGHTSQGGDFDTNQYFNYGIGYAFPVDDAISLNVELAGEEAQVETANTLGLLLGANFMITESLRLAPYVTIGLYDDSPDFSVGLVMEFRP